MYAYLVMTAFCAIRNNNTFVESRITIKANQMPALMLEHKKWKEIINPLPNEIDIIDGYLVLLLCCYTVSGSKNKNNQLRLFMIDFSFF